MEYPKFWNSVAAVTTEVAVTSSHNEATITVTRSDNSNLVVGSVEASPSPGVTFSTLPTTAAASVEITASGLTPATEYTYTLDSLTDGSNPLAPATETETACTS